MQSDFTKNVQHYPSKKGRVLNSKELPMIKDVSLKNPKDNGFALMVNGA
jgi:hypothetical protein